MMSRWRRQREVCCGLTWAPAGYILSLVDVQGSELPAGSGVLTQVASEVRHSSALLAPGPSVAGVGGGQRICWMSQSFTLPLGSQTHLLSLSHVIVLDHLERWLLLTTFSGYTSVVMWNPHSDCTVSTHSPNAVSVIGAVRPFPTVNM